MFRKNWPVFLIFLVVLLVSFFNYQPGTFLTGWDNLHPEFDFELNIKRSLFAAWQEYQGLGLLGGMGHAADLFRQLFLWLVSFLLPISFLRYFYQFLMLLLGPLGVYFLARDIIFEKHERETRSAAGLTAAFFYLFNLATLQMFFVPYEAYAAHFGFLPWEFWSALSFLRHPSKKNLLWVFLINLLALSQGYVATYFLVLLLALGLLFLLYFLKNRQSLKQITLVLAVMFFVNSFWLLPNLYFAFSNLEVVSQAKINIMSTEENLLKNKKFGNLANLALFRGFWFDNLEPGEKGEVNYLLADWEQYLNQPGILAIGYLLFVLGVLGVIFALRKKDFSALLFLPALLVGFTLLASDTPGFSFLASLFFRLPLVAQIFRFPFTKFALLVVLSFSVFYAFFWVFLFSWLRIKKNFGSWLKRLFWGISLFLPLVWLLPVFQGKLFYFKERQEIPFEYFQVFDFFEKEEASRVANFPQAHFWSWNFYRWGYSGSGFLWYGIDQPILDRAFDPWSKENENYFWEISYAVFSQNQALFENVLEKYQINWLLLDENILSLSGRTLAIEELKNLLSSEKFELAAEFGRLKIYKIKLKTQAKDFVFLTQDLPTVGPDYSWTNFDQAYLEKGNYIVEQKPDIYYPFRSLFTGRNPGELDFEISETNDSYIFKRKLALTVADYELKLPEYDGQELLWVDPADLSQIRYLIPQAFLENNSLKVVVPKTEGYFSAAIEPKEDGVVFSQKNQEAVFSFEELAHKFAYLIKIENKNLTGRSLLFWLENLSSQRSDFELYLPDWGTSFLIQPPMKPDGLGYAFHFENIPIGRQKAVNDLKKVVVQLFPYRFLSEIALVSPSISTNEPRLNTLTVNHPNPSLYKVEAKEIPRGSTLVLSQSYHPGWHAYALEAKDYPFKAFLAPVLGKEIKEHVLVNNWENGWQVNSQSSRVYLVFLPQYLEYLGFLLNVFPLLMILKYR
ncbi:MAG TPA: hypothetical protein VMW25_03110 [Clostridia bacterium]|nr:hypothetical protein [Clostridia bacterium]